MIRRALKNTQGVTAVEFGLTAPAFFLLLVGMVQAAMALWTQLGIEHGVQMAARCMAINPTTCDTSDHTKAYAVQQSYGLNIPASTFTAATSTTCAARVSASYPFKFVPMVYKNITITLTAFSCFPN